MPPDPLELSLFFHQIQISSAEKNTLEKNVVIIPPLLKISRYATARPGCWRKKPGQ